MNAPYDEAERFASWLLRRVESDARGDDVGVLTVPPGGRLWLGRLAPEARTRKSILGERGERPARDPHRPARLTRAARTRSRTAGL